ncbi:MAG TPA: hypothetical protein VH165_08200, partial [Kofleriaceae bacterium]|nr:hypothetical protein [Kofleriaceae bacterium]
MIRINLLPARRPRIRPAATNEATRPMVMGLAGLAAVAVLVAALVDRPKRSRLGELSDANRQLQSQIQAKNKQLEGYPQLKKAAEEADD